MRYFSLDPGARRRTGVDGAAESSKCAHEAAHARRARRFFSRVLFFWLAASSSFFLCRGVSDAYASTPSSRRRTLRWNHRPRRCHCRDVPSSAHVDRRDTHRRGRRRHAIAARLHAIVATSSPLHAVAASLHVHAVATRQNAVFDAGGDWGLFGLHAVPDDATELVITEGEYDAMAVYQATGRAAVSLPNGAASLPPAVLPLLERFKRIFLWCDGDEVPARRPSPVFLWSGGVGWGGTTRSGATTGPRRRYDPSVPVAAAPTSRPLTWGRGPRNPSTRNSHRPA